MRRLGLIAVALAALAGVASGSAGADDTATYRVELDNAFGIVEGSQVRVAGVNVGSVTGLAITPEKRAEVTIEVSGDRAKFGTETHCSSEPQSLIAEYFLDCQPAGPPLAEGGLIPVGQTSQTVQLDSVLNTFREPFKLRLQLLLNEFGTGLAGNAENLNAAIRRGAPALGQLDEALGILARRNKTFRGMVVDASEVLSALARRREDITRFIVAAKELSSAAADRGTDLSRDVELFDDLLVELRPTLVELGRVARLGTPLLASLDRSSGELARLGSLFPDFADNGRVALTSLGVASEVGEAAAEEAGEETDALRRSGRDAPAITELLKDLLRDIDDPRRAVEIDARAARTCDDPTRSCWATGRAAPTGYTGMEGVLNYAYYLAGATNQVDAISHLLHVNIYSAGPVGNPCGTWFTGGEPGSANFGVPASDGGLTTNIHDAAPCVSWLGPNQPGLNYEVNLPPYDPSVCPEGSDAPELCNPAGASATATGGTTSGGPPAADPSVPAPGDAPTSPAPGEPGPAAPPSTLPPDVLEDLLDLPPEVIDELLPDAGSGGGSGGGGDEETGALLDFLFGGAP